MVKFRAVAVDVLFLSREKACAKGEETNAELFVEGALYNVMDVKYINARKPFLCNSFLRTRIKAS